MTVAELESSLWAAEDSPGLHVLESASKGGQIREKGIKADAHREQFAYSPKGKPCLLQTCYKQELQPSLQPEGNPSWSWRPVLLPKP